MFHIGEIRTHAPRHQRPVVRRSRPCESSALHPQFAALLALGGLMTIFRIQIFQFGWLLATALSVAICSTASQAYTPEQEQACTGDAFRLCSSDIPDVARVTACMARNKSQLSPPCRAHFRSGPEPDEVAAGAPTNIRPVARKPVASKARKPASKKPATKPAKPAAT